MRVFSRSKKITIRDAQQYNFQQLISTIPKPSKTIEIDEVLPPGEDSPIRAQKPSAASTPDDPFADLKKHLPWKARLTLKLTTWFMFLRSKSWGKWVIAPAVTLTILLAFILFIPLVLITFTYLTIKAILNPK